jgi:hypothetical protein
MNERELIATPSELAGLDAHGEASGIAARAGLPHYMVGQMFKPPSSDRILLAPGVASCMVLNKVCQVQRVVWADEAGSWLYRLDVRVAQRMDDDELREAADYEWLAEDEIELVST